MAPITTATSPTAEPTTVEKMRGLPWSIGGDVANTVFVQFTFFGSVFILFLNALGLSKGQIGFLLSLIPFAGLIALFIAPWVARFGYKRTFLTFWSLRKVVTAFLIFTPWVYATYGEQTAVIYVGVIVALFALSRASAETGKYPWVQEYIPNQVRGKFTALDNLFTTLVGITAVAAAGFVIERNTDLSGFTFLIGVGVIFGAVSVWAYTHVPGGAAVPDSEKSKHRDLGDALRDRSFRNYLLGIGFMTLATIPMTSFLPLFMVEEVGLRDSHVILLQNGTLIGGLVSVYIWGWAADRYGSTPVMLTGVIMRVVLPILWLLMPKDSSWSLYAALAIAFLQGVANMGWLIGSARLLFVSVVPPEKKSDYMALYYAWIGVVGGFSQLLGGWILQYSQNLSIDLTLLVLDPYSPLFLMGLVLPLISLIFFKGVRRDSTISMGTFAGFVLRGNPFMAVESMVRYHMAKDEETTIRLTERLGQTKSLLAVEELLASLADPRFNVRFEAIVAIGRTRPDEQLIAALEEVLHGNDPALSVMAAWALGRIHDERAREPLHEALDSGYRSIRAHSARSLATLGDETAVPELLQRLQVEPDEGLRVAYASALGKFQASEAIELIQPLLADTKDEMARAELALALARMIDEEHNFVRLWRQTNEDPGTTFAQELMGIAKKWQKQESDDPHTELLESAELFSQENLDAGITTYCRFLADLPPERFTAVAFSLLQDCLNRMDQFGPLRLEYVTLSLLILNMEEKTPHQVAAL